MLFMENQGIKSSQNFIYRTSQRQIIHKLMADNSFFIDQKKTAVSNPVFFFQNMKGTRDALVDI